MFRQANHIYELEKSVQWARAFQQTIDRFAQEGIINPISQRITKSINRFHWLPATLQTLLFCRYSELKSIDLADVLQGNPIIIKQSKTRTKRIIKDDLLLFNSQSYDLDPSAKILHTNYDSYRSELKKVIPSRVHGILEYNSDVSHVFRHLHASWLHEHNYSLEEIKEEFDHSDLATTRGYIHNELFLTTNQTKR